MEFPGGGEHIEKWWWGVGGEGYRRPGTDSWTNLESFQGDFRYFLDLIGVGDGVPGRNEAGEYRMVVLGCDRGKVLGLN